MSAPLFNPHAPLTAPSCAAAAYDEPMSTPTSPAPSWIRHAICWQVYPLGFCGAPQRREDLTGESYGDADGENVVHRRSEEHTSELQSRFDLVCRLLLEKKKNRKTEEYRHTS